MAGKPRVVVETIKEVTVVTFQDSALVDSMLIDQIGTAVRKLVDEQARRKLVLDLSKVGHASSSALTILLDLRKRIEAVKGELILCGVNKNIGQMFKLTGLHKLFTFADSEADAFEKLGVQLA